MQKYKLFFKEASFFTSFLHHNLRERNDVKLDVKSLLD